MGEKDSCKKVNIYFFSLEQKQGTHELSFLSSVSPLLPDRPLRHLPPHAFRFSLSPPSPVLPMQQLKSFEFEKKLHSQGVRKRAHDDDDPPSSPPPGHKMNGRARQN